MDSLVADKFWELYDVLVSQRFMLSKQNASIVLRSRFPKEFVISKQSDAILHSKFDLCILKRSVKQDDHRLKFS